MALPILLVDEMRILRAPVNAYGFDDWVNTRVNQFSKILEKYNVYIVQIFLQVNVEDFVKACAFRDSFTSDCVKVNVECDFKVAKGTYWIEFETSSSSLDYVVSVRRGFSESRELAIFQGVLGGKIEAETMWSLWQVDKLDVDTARKVSELL